MNSGIVNPSNRAPIGGFSPWLRLLAGIVGGAFGIALALALGAIVLLTAGTARAQGTDGRAPATAAHEVTPAPAHDPVRERLEAHAGSGLLLMTTAGPVVAPLQATETALKITGPIVRAVVTQRFVNPTDQWIEGRYLFPLPDDAAVDHLRMKVGDRIIEGEVREKEAARRAFAAARSSGRRATLVEQQRPNAFTTEVTNIAPGAGIEITIEFQQTLALKDGTWRLRLPGVVAPRYRSPIDPEALLIEERTRRDSREPATAPVTTSRPLADGEWQPPTMRQGWLLVSADGVGSRIDAAVDADVDSTADANVDAIDVETLANEAVTSRRAMDQPVLLPGQAAINPIAIRVELDAGVPIGLPRSPSHVVRVAMTHIGANGSGYRITTRGDEPADRDFELEWSPSANALPQATMRLESFGGLHYGLLAINPPATSADSAVRQPRETTFVVDTSGSMGGESIEQARGALLFALERLQPGDWFNIIQFNSTHSSIFPRPEPVTRESLARARRYVAGLRADGGTEMGGAIRQALSAPLPPDLLGQVVFITDGAVEAENELVSLIRQRIGARRLYTVGIGSAPNGFFMRKAAEIGGGTFTYIGRTSEVEARMAKLFDKLAKPVSTDLAVRFDGGVLAEPLDLPRDLHAGEPLIVFARFTEPPRAVEVSAASATADGERRWRVPVAIAPVSESGLPGQWARGRIERLSDALRQARFTAQPRDDLRKSIVDLALAHHLVSDFTSLVAVDRTPVRPADEALARADVPANLPAGWDHAKVFGQVVTTTQSSRDTVLARTATPAPLQLALGVLALAVGFLLLLSRRWSCVIGRLTGGRR